MGSASWSVLVLERNKAGKLIAWGSTAYAPRSNVLGISAGLVCA